MSLSRAVLLLLSASLPATAVGAATIVSLTGASQYVDLATAASKDLSDNGAYSSGVGSDAIGYVLREGEFVAPTNAKTTAIGIAGKTVQSFLLHYDPQVVIGPNGGTRTGVASGSFDILLGAGESYAGLAGYTGNSVDVFANADALTMTDFNASVTYPVSPLTLRNARATEGTNFGDLITLATLGNRITVTYSLTSLGTALDQTRFFVNSAAPVIPPPVTAVPEPASWAMMIGGFGLVGTAMRRRRTATLATA